MRQVDFGIAWLKLMFFFPQNLKNIFIFIYNMCTHIK